MSGFELNNESSEKIGLPQINLEILRTLQGVDGIKKRHLGRPLKDP